MLLFVASPPFPSPPPPPDFSATRLVFKASAPAGQPPPHVAVRAALPAWVAMGASPWFVGVIRDGLSLPWVAELPRWRPPPIPLPADVLRWAVVEVGRWCERGFARRARAAEARRARWVSASFVVDINTRPRLVVNYKHQNAYLEDRPIRYAQLADFVMDLALDDHLTSWDVADAFHHVFLAKEEGSRLAFSVAGVVYVPLTMP